MPKHKRGTSKKSTGGSKKKTSTRVRRPPRESRRIPGGDLMRGLGRGSADVAIQTSMGAARQDPRSPRPIQMVVTVGGKPGRVIAKAKKTYNEKRKRQTPTTQAERTRKRKIAEKKAKKKK